MKGKHEYSSRANLVENEGRNEDREAAEEDHSKAEKKTNMADFSPVAGEPTFASGIPPETVEERVLTPDEKSYLLCVERGDVSTSKSIIKAMERRPQIFDMNCVDPLGRSALIIAVENENRDMIEMLLEAGIKIKDALLVAIREDYVDGVEILLRHEEDTHDEGSPYSWEIMEESVANFTADITPLILAAHRNNYEILKMLLDRGATIPIPHDVKCSCEDCVIGSADDSLKFSLARINAYRALAAPSLIALSSSDPILTAFQLSDELKRLARAESQFREEYIKLRTQVQQFVSGLVDQARTSYELEVILNHDPDGDPWQTGDFQTLARLKLAVQYKQKSFVAHPSVQQLLAAIWYEGLPGFRRKHVARQLLDILWLALLFPINSFMYILAPYSTAGKFMRNPFVKFISHSASFMFFLMLLALASQRIEHVIISVICYTIPGTEWLAEIKANWEKHERGALPHVVELLIIVWVQGLIWSELKSLWHDGLIEHLKNLWNLADIFAYGSFMAWIGLRVLAWLIVQKEQWDGVDPDLIWRPREDWHPYEPQLLAEAMFGAGMIASYLKVVHILSINPYMGPLQIALGKMVIDIIKWMFLYCLVVFAFGCGMNQLLWYYADLEKQECYSLPGGLPDFDNEPESCVSWRRFSNLWEASQSLFWASFGLVDLADFELKGIKEFTRFWSLLMFGSYSVCNIIVLLNMLIAMMSNSYQLIHERSDVEWKFSRSKLWISYFGPGDTVPSPFNLVPSPKSLLRLICCRKAQKKVVTSQEHEEASMRYKNVMKHIIRRYITSEQRKSEDFSITEDDIQEVRQDINSFKYELLNIFRNNNMKVPESKTNGGIMGRKSKNMERQIQKGFQITKIEGIMEAFCTASQDEKPKDVFRRFAKLVGEKKNQKKTSSLRRSSIRGDPIGSTENSIRRHRNSLKRSLLQRGNSQMEIKMVLTRLNSEELVAFNPNLSEIAPLARRAYAKFKSALENYNEQYEKDNRLAVKTHSVADKSPRTRDSIRKMIIERAKSVDSTGSIESLVADLEKMIDKKADTEVPTGAGAEAAKVKSDGEVKKDQKQTEGKKDVEPGDKNAGGGKSQTGKKKDEEKEKEIKDEKKSEQKKIHEETKDGIKQDPSTTTAGQQIKDIKKEREEKEQKERQEQKEGGEKKDETAEETKRQPQSHDNASFVYDEPKVKLTPPSHQGSIAADEVPPPAAAAVSRPASRRPSASRPGGAASAVAEAGKSDATTPQPSPLKQAATTVETPAERLETGLIPPPSAGPSRAASPKSRPKQAPSEPTASSPTAAKPSPAKLSAKAFTEELMPPASAPTPRGSPGPARAADTPAGKFDPEGRSAVSGQKRTGWI